MENLGLPYLLELRHNIIINIDSVLLLESWLKTINLVITHLSDIQIEKQDAPETKGYLQGNIL